MSTTASTLLFLVGVIVASSLIAQFLVPDPRWKNLLYIVSAVVTVATLIFWVFHLFGLTRTLGF